MSPLPNELITIDAAAGTAEAYVARPDGPGPHPGVLLCMDAIGLRPQIEKMADRIASWGHVVLAPNVFYRWGSAADIAPKVDLDNPESRGEFMKTVMPLVHALTDDLATADLSAYIDVLHGLDGVSDGPIGASGYCMGGRLALLAAAERPADVAAIGMFHTGGLVTDEADSPHRRLAEIRATVLAVHADNDRSLPPEAVQAFEEALTAAGVAHAASVYPGAVHGYTMADTAAYHPDAAEYHFDELQKLFANTLPTG
ncbi:dienelactone hydrolase family protein [Gordonia sp. CPCC 206044]|uniref:dienelactone hydrolase family protein n=1 Tax=Gordonia sp. CPCC 206044 TaxID=3140793 RepID=UPI003AF3D33D